MHGAWVNRKWGCIKCMKKKTKPAHCTFYAVCEWGISLRRLNKALTSGVCRPQSWHLDPLLCSLKSLGVFEIINTAPLSQTWAIGLEVVAGRGVTGSILCLWLIMTLKKKSRTSTRQVWLKWLWWLKLPQIVRRQRTVTIGAICRRTGSCFFVANLLKGETGRHSWGEVQAGRETRRRWGSWGASEESCQQNSSPIHAQPGLLLAPGARGSLRFRAREGEARDESERCGSSRPSLGHHLLLLRSDSQQVRPSRCV